MRFPETGDYVFPKGLATVHIDQDQTRASTGAQRLARPPELPGRGGPAAATPARLRPLQLIPVSQDPSGGGQFRELADLHAGALGRAGQPLASATAASRSSAEISE